MQSLFPSAERVRFTASGSEATMLAIRIGRAHSGRPKVLRFEGHYNGWHDYAVVGSAPPYDLSPSLGVLPAAAEATGWNQTGALSLADSPGPHDDAGASDLARPGVRARGARGFGEGGGRSVAARADRRRRWCGVLSPRWPREPERHRRRYIRDEVGGRLAGCFEPNAKALPLDRLPRNFSFREAVGDEVTLMVDANCAYDGDVATAIRVGRALEELDIYWFEKPLSEKTGSGCRTELLVMGLPGLAELCSSPRIE